MFFDTIRLGDHPYTYARVCAMKGKLIGTDQYHRLLKMRVNEILKYLQETTYKREIDEMMVTHLGLESVELVLNKNLVRTLRKLKRISDGGLALLITKYLERYDIYNFKTVLRGRFTRTSNEKIESMLLNVGTMHKAFILNLMKKESVEPMLDDIEKALCGQYSAFAAGGSMADSADSADSADIPSNGKGLMGELRLQLAAARDAFKKSQNLFEIENVLDHHYYASLLAFTRRIAGQGALFKQFLLHEIDVLNLRILLRLKREKIPQKEIEKFLFFSGARLSRHTLLRLLKIDRLDHLVEEIKKSGYCRAADAETFAKSESLIDIENHLSHYLLSRANLLLHQHVLSINVILGYMLAKEIEVRNLKVLIKGKRLGLSEQFLASELVTR